MLNATLSFSDFLSSDSARPQLVSRRQLFLWN